MSRSTHRFQELHLQESAQEVPEDKLVLGVTYLQIKRIYMFYAVQMKQLSPQILNILSKNYLQKLHVQIPTLGHLRK